MLGDLAHVEKIYIHTGYTDMRKQLNGLVEIIQYNFKLDPYSNTLFLFCGRRADRIKDAGQREELVKSIPHSKVLHTIDDSEKICEKCGGTMAGASKTAEAILRLNKLFGNVSIVISRFVSR